MARPARFPTSFWFLAILCAAGLLSCDGDSHHHARFDSRTSADGTHHQGGLVVVFVADTPRPDLEAFHVTFTSIALLGPDRQRQVLYDDSGGYRVDLLTLRRRGDRHIHEVLVAGAEPPPVRYHGIRVTVTDPVLVLSPGEVIRGSRVELVGGGHLELLPAEPLEVSPRRPLFLVLDFDVERSVEPAGEDAAAWRVRPVILVDVLDGDPRQEIDTPVELTGSVAWTSPGGDSLDVEIDGARGHAEVVLDHETVLLDRHLSRTSDTLIELGGAVTARGQFDADGRFRAQAVILADTVPLRGTILGLPTGATGAGDGTILLDLGLDLVPDDVDPGHVLPGEFAAGDDSPSGGAFHAVRITADTLLTLGRRGVASPGDLHPGMAVTVRARSAGAEGVPSTAALIDLEVPSRRD